MCKQREQLSQEKIEVFQKTTGKNVAFIKQEFSAMKPEKSEANTEFVRITIVWLKSKYIWKDSIN